MERKYCFVTPLEQFSISKIYTMSKSIYEDKIGYYEALGKTIERFQKDDSSHRRNERFKGYRRFTSQRVHQTSRGHN
jgi:hypothetical protein